MQSRKFAALLIFFILFSLSSMAAYSVYGDFVEKTIAFLTSLMVFFVLVALFDIYRQGHNLTMKEKKVIAMSFPLLTIIEYVYPVLKYSEQKHSDYVYPFLMDFTISLLVFTIIWSNVKNVRSQ